MAGTIERQDVYSLPGPWHPVLRAYALAIGVMRDKPDSDPLSLGYQAAVHGVGDPRDPPPDNFRSQCQHNTWYFLPWHRWYLYYFEQVVRSVLTTIPEVPADVAASWALPYWNYARPGANKLPPEFAADKRWDGKDNPLYDSTRRPGVNERTAALDPRSAAPRPGVLTQPFSSPSDRVSTFGGTQSKWHHYDEPSTLTGGLEVTPHNAVHQFVLGDMGDFSTAGLDPVFWLHHCNIDRYWEVRGHAGDPTGWTVPFSFLDATANEVQVLSDGCVDTVGQLGHRYDDTTSPAPATPGDAVRARRGVMAADVPRPELPPEVVGSHGLVNLQGERIDVPIQVGSVTNEFRNARAGQSEPQRIFLTVEDIRAETDPGISYAVYLGEAVDEQLAGMISLFGVTGTRRAGHAVGFAFDVTDIVDALRDDDAWDPNDVHVVFEPVGAVYDDNDGPSLKDTAQVEVGTVKIVYQ